MRISDWSSDVCSSDSLLLQHGVTADEGVLLEVDEAVEPRLRRRVDRAVFARPGAVALLQAQGEDCAEAELAQAEILARRQQVVIEAPQVVRRHPELVAEEIGRASCRERVCQSV